MSGIRRAMWSQLLQNAACAVHVEQPSPQYFRHGISAMHRRDKMVRLLRRRIDRAMRGWPFVRSEERGLSMHYALDGNALKQGPMLCQAILAHGQQVFQYVESSDLLPQEGGASRYTHRIRRLLSDDTGIGRVGTARGDAGEAALHQLMAGLIEGIPQGSHGQTDLCWFDEDTDIDVARYLLRGNRGGVTVFRHGERVLEQDALVLHGDKPDTMTLLDATTSKTRLHEKIEDRERAFRKFRSSVRGEGIDVQMIHVLFDDDLEGWCDMATGEGTSRLRREFRSEIATALAASTHKGIHVVALPHRDRVESALRREVRIAQNGVAYSHSRRRRRTISTG